MARNNVAYAVVVVVVAMFTQFVGTTLAAPGYKARVSWWWQHALAAPTFSIDEDILRAFNRHVHQMPTQCKETPSCRWDSRRSPRAHSILASDDPLVPPPPPPKKETPFKILSDFSLHNHQCPLGSVASYLSYVDVWLHISMTHHIPSRPRR